MRKSMVQSGVTILITTKNRKDDLRRALLSAIEQKGVSMGLVESNYYYNTTKKEAVSHMRHLQKYPLLVQSFFHIPTTKYAA